MQTIQRLLQQSALSIVCRHILAVLWIIASITLFIYLCTVRINDKLHLKAKHDTKYERGCSWDYEGRWQIGIIPDYNTSNLFHATGKQILNSDDDTCHNFISYDCDDVYATAKDKDLFLSFIADPFLIIHHVTKDWYLFYELKNLQRGVGEIGVSVSSNEGRSWNFLGIALSEWWHFSYPNVVYFEDKFCYSGTHQNS